MCPMGPLPVQVQYALAGLSLVAGHDLPLGRLQLCPCAVAGLFYYHSSRVRRYGVALQPTHVPRAYKRVWSWGPVVCQDSPAPVNLAHRLGVPARGLPWGAARTAEVHAPVDL